MEVEVYDPRECFIIKVRVINKRFSDEDQVKISDDGSCRDNRKLL